MPMDLEEAIKFIEKAVKESHVKNQGHIDPTLLGADQYAALEAALISVRVSIQKGSLTEEEFKTRVGLA